MNALNLSKDSVLNLKPCPFCGGTNLKTGGDDKIVGVWCLTCEAAGPNHYGSREWNDRHDETPSEFERLCGKENSHV